MHSKCPHFLLAKCSKGRPKKSSKCYLLLYTVYYTLVVKNADTCYTFCCILFTILLVVKNADTCYTFCCVLFITLWQSTYYTFGCILFTILLVVKNADTYYTLVVYCLLYFWQSQMWTLTTPLVVPYLLHFGSQKCGYLLILFTTLLIVKNADNYYIFCCTLIPGIFQYIFKHFLHPGSVL